MPLTSEEKKAKQREKDRAKYRRRKARNPNYSKEKFHRWRSRNPEKYKQNCMKWILRKTDPVLMEKHNLGYAIWKANNREKFLAYQKAYDEKRKEEKRVTERERHRIKRKHAQATQFFSTLHALNQLSQKIA
jgi:hypothetical protein